MARRARLTEPPPEPEWVTLAETAQRLGMSKAWFGALAKSEGIHVVRRGSRPGVDWRTVETYIARSRVTRVDESLRPHPDPRRPVRGVALMDRVQAQHKWSDRQLARALGVTPVELSRYRRSGVPDHRVSRLRRLSRLPLGDTAACPHL
jgi:transcriptional regulator with XRE-family HTH domain